MVHLAAFHGAQDAMQERLMRAYLTEGELMSDHAALARLAGEVGLPAAEVEELLAGDRFAAEVRAEQELARGFGISAVPVLRGRAHDGRRRRPAGRGLPRAARPGLGTPRARHALTALPDDRERLLLGR